MILLFFFSARPVAHSAVAAADRTDLQSFRQRTHAYRAFGILDPLLLWRHSGGTKRV